MLASEAFKSLEHLGITVVKVEKNRLYVTCDGQNFTVEINVFSDVAVKLPHISGVRPIELWLTDVGEKKIQTIKNVRVITGWGLKVAKDFVDSVGSVYVSGPPPQPKFMLSNLSQDEANAHSKLLIEGGAQVSVRGDLPPVNPFERRIVEDRLHRFERELSQ